MSTYIIIAVLNTLFLSIYYMKIISKKKYVYLITIGCIFILGQRWNGGVDFYGYFLYYYTHFPAEIGYRYIQDYLSFHNIYFGIFLFLIYCFTTIGSIYFLLKWNPSILTVYFYFLSEFHIMSINPLRTYIAIVFFLIGFYKRYLNDKSWVYYYVYVYIATLFHKVAILGFLFPIYIYIIKKVLENKKTEKIYYGLLLILPFVSFRKFIIFVAEGFNYAHYFNSPYDIPLSNLNILRYIIMVLIYIFLNNTYYLREKNDKKIELLKICMGCYLLIMGMAIDFGLLHRVAYFFKIFELLYLTYFFKWVKKSVIKKFIIMILYINYIFIYYKDLGYLKYNQIKILKLKDEEMQIHFRDELKKINTTEGRELRKR